MICLVLVQNHEKDYLLQGCCRFVEGFVDGWEEFWELLCLVGAIGEMGSRRKLWLLSHQFLRTDERFHRIIELPNTLLSVSEIT